MWEGGREAEGKGGRREGRREMQQGREREGVLEEVGDSLLAELFSLLSFVSHSSV